MMHSTIKRYIYLLTGAVVISACSMTKGVPDDDQLFIGLTKINYTDYEENDNYSATREEIDAAWQQLLMARYWVAAIIAFLSPSVFRYGMLFLPTVLVLVIG